MYFNFCTLIDSKMRVDIYLSALFNDFSISYIQKMVDRWYVEVNGIVINKNIKISPRDEIKISLKIDKLEVEPQDIPLDIVFEDENIVLVNKDANTNTHPVPGEEGKINTLVNALMFHISDLSSIWWVERPWIVHRLDKDTSGLIMVAKNDKMMLYLQDIIKNRTNIWKYYLAIVSWIVKENLKIESFIWRDPNNRIKMTAKPNALNPKIAISFVTPIAYIWDKYSLVEVKIETWRTHQIRVHLSSIWYPIIWDKVYWNLKVNKDVETEYGLTRQALHSYKLEIEIYGKNQTFIAPLKADMQKILDINNIKI